MYHVIYKLHLQGGNNLGRIASVYSLEYEKWTEMPSMGTARYHHSCAQLGTNIYVLGGVDLMSTEVFDLNTNTWTSGPNMPTMFDYGQTFSFQDNLYALRQQETVYKLADDKKEWAEIGDIGKVGQRIINPALVVDKRHFALLNIVLQIEQRNKLKL
jgi:hypothetical protein